MYNSKIAGLGKYLPDNVVTNDDLSKVWIQLMNGSQKEQELKKKAH